MDSVLYLKQKCYPKLSNRIKNNDLDNYKYEYWNNRTEDSEKVLEI